MRHLIIFLIIGLLGYSGQKTEQKDNLEKVNENISANDCPDKEFTRKYDDVLIKALYATCELDWKYKLKILKNGKLVYQADSLMEFEFNDSFWPSYLKISEDSLQILLEVNDRPFTNYILGLYFIDNELISSNRFPLFKSEPLDFDNDGNLEYSGYSYTTERYTNDSCYYNPIIFVEKNNFGLRLDKEQTKRASLNLHGVFHGFEANQDIIMKCPSIKSVKKYLNN